MDIMFVVLQEVHKEVPYQVERRVCPGDSDWDDVRDNVGGSFSAGTIANAFNQATRNDNDNNVGGGREVIPGVRNDDILGIIDEIALKSTGGSSEIEEEADPNDDAIVFG